MDYMNKYLDKNDRRIRKIWLISTVVLILTMALTLVAIGGGIFYSLDTMPQNATQEPHITSQITTGLAIGVAALFLICLSYWYALFYCAHRKYGTRFLTCNIIIQTLSLISSLPKALGGFAAICALLPPALSLLIALPLILASFVIPMWQLWMSVQLRMVNRSLQEIAVRSSPAFAEAIASVARATTLIAAEEAFESVIREWPRLLFRSTCIRLLRVDYNNKRISLLCGK